RVAIAAINSPDSVTFSGDRGSLSTLAEVLAAQGRFHRMLEVEVAYHSHHMDPLEDELLEALAGLAPAAPSLPLYSTVTGTRMEGDLVDAAYWWRNVRQAVRFEQAVRSLAADGYTIFLEVGPRSEEHTSELQSRENLVCRLLLEKRKQGRSARNEPC